MSLFEQFIGLNIDDPKAWFSKAEAILGQSAVMDYWTRRLSFSGKPQESETVLIGAGRIAAILSNVVIPFLAASGVRITPLLDFLPPEEDNSLIRRTAFVLFGRDHNPALYQNGLRQQGLLQIFNDFCLNNKTACADCRFAEALSKLL